MSKGFNKTILMGNLARDPDIRHTTSKQKVARITVAVSRQWKDKATGEAKSQTDFIPVVAWSFLADICERYLSKGKPVLLEGRLQVREYEDAKTGGRKWATEVIAENMTLLPSGRRENDPPVGEPEASALPPAQTAGSIRDDDFPLDFDGLGGEDVIDVPF